jgi:hypothetical protein
MASEKNLGRNKFKNLNAAIALVAAWVFVLVSLFLEIRYHYLEIFANINILLGTLIWGYGDLLELF